MPVEDLGQGCSAFLKGCIDIGCRFSLQLMEYIIIPEKCWCRPEIHMSKDRVRQVYAVHGAIRYRNSCQIIQCKEDVTGYSYDGHYVKKGNKQTRDQSHGDSPDEAFYMR